MKLINCLVLLFHYALCSTENKLLKLSTNSSHTTKSSEIVKSSFDSLTNDVATKDYNKSPLRTFRPKVIGEKKKKKERKRKRKKENLPTYTEEGENRYKTDSD